MSLSSLGHVELAEGDPSRAAARYTRAAPLFQVISNPLFMPWSLQGLTAVAAANQAWELAARLCGARNALHASLGLGLPGRTRLAMPARRRASARSSATTPLPPRTSRANHAPRTERWPKRASDCTEGDPRGDRLPHACLSIVMRLP
jgi:hypothetical protein